LFKPWDLIKPFNDLRAGAGIP